MARNVERFFGRVMPPPPRPFTQPWFRGYISQKCLHINYICLPSRSSGKASQDLQILSLITKWFWASPKSIREKFDTDHKLLLLWNILKRDNDSQCQLLQIKVWWPTLHGIGPSARKNVRFQRPCPMNSTIDCSEGAQRNPSPRTTSWVWQQCFRTSIQLRSDLTA